MNTQPAINLPWYRIPYVWLVIFFPVLAVVGGIITVVLAINTDDGLVVDDYYKKGLEINKDLARDRMAEQFELRIGMQVEKQTFTISLDGNNQFSPPGKIRVTFFRKTSGGDDKFMLLKRDTDGRYRGALPELMNGYWEILIEGDGWRLFHDYLAT